MSIIVVIKVILEIFGSNGIGSYRRRCYRKNLAQQIISKNLQK